MAQTGRAELSAREIGLQGIWGALPAQKNAAHLLEVSGMPSVIDYTNLLRRLQLKPCASPGREIWMRQSIAALGQKLLPGPSTLTGPITSVV